MTTYYVVKDETNDAFLTSLYKSGTMFTGDYAQAISLSDVAMATQFMNYCIAQDSQSRTFGVYKVEIDISEVTITSV